MDWIPYALWIAGAFVAGAALMALADTLNAESAKVDAVLAPPPAVAPTA